uniref:Uncharacterized protein n=1 Tax=Rhizophora mucronata TaxID=61149 RepID=A0A2P2PBH3_RHIMU
MEQLVATVDITGASKTLEALSQHSTNGIPTTKTIRENILYNKGKPL